MNEVVAIVDDARCAFVAKATVPNLQELAERVRALACFSEHAKQLLPWREKLMPEASLPEETKEKLRKVMSFCLRSSPW